MLFNSIIFILVFLPLSVIGFYILSKYTSNNNALFFLTLCSLFFYGWWEPKYIFLILFSILVNYTFVHLMYKSNHDKVAIKLLLTLGVIFNLCLLGFFKYFDFFITVVNEITIRQFNSWEIVLPLAISFFTFQQIAYLIDASQGKVKEKNVLNYFLFVTFFPQLIAGPIVHHSEMMPQFKIKDIYRDRFNNIAIGITIFIIGLFKKVIIADQMAYWSDKTFAANSIGVELGMLDAWLGLICFSFQIYFDFSGYTDMAIGAARMFGIKLPLNFNSPYKSVNIIEFWRHWHITLSRFLRDYLYYPLGGNKCSVLRNLINLMIVMLLGGLWHGAGLTFIVWGGLHGTYLIINHLWRKIIYIPSNIFTNSIAKLITFFSVTYAWVFFRSDSFSSAIDMSKALFGFNGIVLPEHYSDIFSGILSPLTDIGVVFGATTTFGGGHQVAWILLVFFIIWFMPNTQELMRNYKPTVNYVSNNNLSMIFTWVPNVITGVITSVISIYLIFKILQGQPGEFIYFQF